MHHFHAAQEILACTHIGLLLRVCNLLSHRIHLLVVCCLCIRSFYLLQEDIAPPTQKKRKIVIPSEPSAPTENSTEIKPIVKHVLSKEMQLYFEKITYVALPFLSLLTDSFRSAIKGKDEAVFDSALNSLRSDPSLHQLLPYFTQFISDEVQ